MRVPSYGFAEPKYHCPECGMETSLPGLCMSCTTAFNTALPSLESLIDEAFESGVLTPTFQYV